MYRSASAPRIRRNEPGARSGRPPSRAAAGATQYLSPESPISRTRAPETATICSLRRSCLSSGDEGESLSGRARRTPSLCAAENQSAGGSRLSRPICPLGRCAARPVSLAVRFPVPGIDLRPPHPMPLRRLRTLYEPFFPSCAERQKAALAKGNDPLKHCAAHGPWAKRECISPQAQAFSPKHLRRDEHIAMPDGIDGSLLPSQDRHARTQVPSRSFRTGVRAGQEPFCPGFPATPASFAAPSCPPGRSCRRRSAERRLPGAPARSLRRCFRWSARHPPAARAGPERASCS